MGGEASHQHFNILRVKISGFQDFGNSRCQDFNVSKAEFSWKKIFRGTDNVIANDDTFWLPLRS